jgi:hypothetical protein
MVMLPGASSAAVVKRLKCLTDCLAEIITTRLYSEAFEMAGCMRGGVTGIPGSQVDGFLAADAGGSVGPVMGVPGSEAGGAAASSAGRADVVTGVPGRGKGMVHAAAAAAARTFVWGILDELPSLVLQPGEAVRLHVAE